MSTVTSTTSPENDKLPVDPNENPPNTLENHKLPPITESFPRESTSLGLPINNFGMFPSSNKSPLPAFEYIAPAQHHVNLNAGDFPLMELNRVGMFPSSFLHRRHRGEKRPIPEEQKDEKYYERRKRNNEAAKKSRDARKIREDRIAFRAALLEQENSLLRAQVLALRDELQTIRQLMRGSRSSGSML